MRSDAKLVTYVYKVGCKVDGTFCAGTWFPCPPEKACVGVLYTPLENPGCYNPFAPTSIGYMDKNKNKK